MKKIFYGLLISFCVATSTHAENSWEFKTYYRPEDPQVDTMLASVLMAAKELQFNRGGEFLRIDRDNYLVIGSTEGLYKINVRTKSFKNILSTSIDVKYKQLYADDDTVWFIFPTLLGISGGVVHSYYVVGVNRDASGQTNVVSKEVLSFYDASATTSYRLNTDFCSPDTRGSFSTNNVYNWNSQVDTSIEEVQFSDENNDSINDIVFPVKETDCKTGRERKYKKIFLVKKSGVEEKR